MNHCKPTVGIVAIEEFIRISGLFIDKPVADIIVIVNNAVDGFLRSQSVFVILIADRGISLCVLLKLTTEPG